MNGSELQQQRGGGALRRGALLEPTVGGKSAARVYFSCFNSTEVGFDLGPWRILRDRHEIHLLFAYGDILMNLQSCSHCPPWA